MSTVPDDFEDILTAAERAARTDWEMEFVESLREKFKIYRHTMFLSEKQKEILDGILER